MRNIGRWILLPVFIISLPALVIYMMLFITGCYSNETYNGLQAYYLSTASNKLLAQKASDILGDDWDRICIINKYSTDAVIQDAIGRKFALLEKLNWFYISQIADFSEQTVMIYELNGVFSRMEPPLSKYIDSALQSDKITKDKALCFSKKDLFIRRKQGSETLELFFKN